MVPCPSERAKFSFGDIGRRPWPGGGGPDRFPTGGFDCDLPKKEEILFTLPLTGEEAAELVGLPFACHPPPSSPAWAHDWDFTTGSAWRRGTDRLGSGSRRDRPL